jgi:hypothetical protein
LTRKSVVCSWCARPGATEVSRGVGDICKEDVCGVAMLISEGGWRMAAWSIGRPVQRTVTRLSCLMLYSPS